jgi:hypothetical protein
MGQLLIVQGEDERQVQSVFQKGLCAFEKLAKLRPQQELSSGSTAAAKFPKLLKPTSGIIQNSIVPGWITGAGTWFYDGHTGELALAVLLRALVSGNQSLERCLDAADGMFVIASGNPTTNELVVITDRIGILHVYTTRINSCLVLSTSSMVLAALSQPAWDYVSCREFLATGTVFSGQRTLFQGIEKLEQATVFRYRRGCLQSRIKYWDLSAVMYDRAQVQANVEQVAAALEDSLKVVSRSFTRPLFDLTGGMDSRAVLGARLQLPGEFDTVVNGGESDPDVQVANRIAQEFRLRHRREAPRVECVRNWWSKAQESLALCDGEYDVLHYARVLDVHSRLAGEFDATVNGAYGELGRGLYWELLVPFTGWKGHFDQKALALGRYAYVGEIPNLMAHCFQDSLLEHFEEVVQRANVGWEERPNTVKMDNNTLTVYAHRWYGRIASATCRVWPCVSPFLWRGPMEASLSAPPGVRVRNRMHRRLIEHFSPLLARVPLTDGCPALPLRLNTAHLFHPMAGVLYRALKRKIRRAFPTLVPAVPTSPNPIRRLWQETDMGDCLNPATMASRDLYNVPILDRLLSASRAESFPEAKRFGRIVTLELLARALGK